MFNLTSYHPKAPYELHLWLKGATTASDPVLPHLRRLAYLWLQVLLMAKTPILRLKMTLKASKVVSDPSGCHLWIVHSDQNS
jgi:hypothetical protein